MPERGHSVYLACGAQFHRRGKAGQAVVCSDCGLSPSLQRLPMLQLWNYPIVDSEVMRLYVAVPCGLLATPKKKL